MVKTIGNYGCLLCAYNSLASYWKLCTDTPDRFLTRMKNAGAMTGPYLNPGALRTAFPTKVTYLGYETRSTLLNARIRASISRGIPVPARVDFKPATPDQFEQHWVLIVGYTDTDFIMADPWHGDVQPVSLRYGIAGDDILEGIFYELTATTPPPQPTGNARMGLHADADGRMPAADYKEFTDLRPGVIKVLSSHSFEAINRLATEHPTATFIIRAFLSFWENGKPRVITPVQFVNDTINDVKRAVNAIAAAGKGQAIWVELHNEPNLIQEGLGGAWSNGTTFGVWLTDVLTRYDQALPQVKYLFPGLSPGPTVPGVRQDSTQFMNQCLSAAALCDGLGVHSYWNHIDAPLSTALAVVDGYLTQVPTLPVWVTEASSNKGATAEKMATDYVTFWREMLKRPRVQGVTYYVCSASDPAFANETWTPRGLGAKVRGKM